MLEILEKEEFSDKLMILEIKDNSPEIPDKIAEVIDKHPDVRNRLLFIAFSENILPDLAEKMPDTKFLWIGDGELQTQVVNYIKEHDTNHIVKLLGNRTDVADLYQAMDLFFLPSQFEGLPVTALEAQASGLPCLVSDTVSDEFVYTDLVTFFSLNDDIPKITNIIRFLLSKKYDRSVYGQKLQESRFSDSNAGANLLQLYREMLEKENHN